MATIAEKILAAHSGRESVSPGEFVDVSVDVVLANDITAPISLDEFRKLGVAKVFDPDKVVLVQDHFIPNKDIPSAIQAKVMREFAHEQGVVYFEAGRAGSNMHCCLRRALSGPVRSSSAPILTPARTGRLAPFPQEWVPRISPWHGPPAISG